MIIHMHVVSWSKIKQIALALLFLSLSYEGRAQKHDYIWMNGYDAEWGGEFGNFLLDFNQKPVQVNSFEFQNTPLDGQVSNFSDNDGNLIVVSNGCRFYDKHGNILKGGDTLNPGMLSNSYCKNNGSYPFNNNMILLPINEKVIAFHLGMRDDNKFTLTRWPTYQTTINIKGDEPMVESKNIKINAFHAGSPFACKHGNGKNWWVISPEKDANTYYI